MIPILKKDWALVRYRGGINLMNRRFSGDGISSLSVAEAIAVTMCTGEHTRQEIDDHIFKLTKETVDWQRLERALDESETVTTNQVPQLYSFARQMDLCKRPWPYYKFRESSINSANFILTHICNHQCTYCYQGDGHWKEDRLSVSFWMDTLEQFIQMGLNDITITGGESILHPAFWPLLEKCSKYGIYVTVQSNATRYTDTDIHRLAELGVAHMYISFPSAIPEIYDRVTHSRGDLPRLISSLHRFHEEGLKVRVKSVITAENGEVEDIQKILEICADAKVEHVHLAIYSKTYPDGEIHIPNRAKRAKIQAFCDENYDKMNVNFGYKGEDFFRFGDYSKVYRCGGIKNNLTVLPDGTLSVCEPAAMAGLYRYGPLQTGKLEDIWFSSQLDAVNIPGEYKGECADCENHDNCKSGCMFRSYLDSGECWGTDPRCFKSKSDFYHLREDDSCIQY